MLGGCNRDRSQRGARSGRGAIEPLTQIPLGREDRAVAHERLDDPKRHTLLRQGPAEPIMQGVEPRPSLRLWFAGSVADRAMRCRF